MKPAAVVQGQSAIKRKGPVPAPPEERVLNNLKNGNPKYRSTIKVETGLEDGQLDEILRRLIANGNVSQSGQQFNLVTKMAPVAKQAPPLTAPVAAPEIITSIPTTSNFTDFSEDELHTLTALLKSDKPKKLWEISTAVCISAKKMSESSIGVEQFEAVSEILSDLAKDGYIDIIPATDSGSTLFKLTEDGQKIAQAWLATEGKVFEDVNYWKWSTIK